MVDKRLKIAYITSTDAKNRHAWSGTQFSIWNALQKHTGDVELIGPVKPFFALWIGKIATGLGQKIFHKRYNYRHSKILAKAYARIINKHLQKNSFDLIVVPATSTFIPFLKTSVPIAYIGDATVINGINYYKSLSNLFSFSKKETIKIEKKAIEKSTFLIYSSEWARNSAISDFHKDPSKVFVAFFGPNMEDLPNKEIILAKQKQPTCNLLFIGMNWNDKGGSVAYQTMLELNKMGLETTLTVCGCIPPKKINHPKIKIHPFLDKNDRQQRKILSDIFLHSDFFILPTHFDCTPIVLCESYAFGLPVIGSDTGGMSAVIKNGFNGYLMPASADGKAYAEKIFSLFKNAAAYKEMSLNCRNSYETQYNWDEWASLFNKAYEDTVLKTK